MEMTQAARNLHRDYPRAALAVDDLMIAILSDQPAQSFDPKLWGSMLNFLGQVTLPVLLANGIDPATVSIEAPPPTDAYIAAYLALEHLPAPPCENCQAQIVLGMARTLASLLGRLHGSPGARYAWADLMKGTLAPKGARLLPAV